MEDVLVPIVLFLSIPATVWLVSYFNARKRLTVHETLRYAIDKGQELSPEMMEKMSLLTDPVRADLRRGVLFLAFGAAFAIFATIMGRLDTEAMIPMLGISVFPIALGLAYLGLWMAGRGQSS